MNRDLRLLQKHLTLLLVALTALVLTVLAPVMANDTKLDFSLINHEGSRFDLDELRGKIVLVFFGYTRCPDVCPIELQTMASALQGLGDDAQLAQGLFITVDPENDSPEVLQQYMQFFGGTMLGLTGTKQQIDQATQQFKVTYQKHARDDGHYTMDHSANLFVIDHRGVLNAIVPFGFPAAHIESLLDEMIAALK